MAQNGGKRPGAGRPKGSGTKPVIRDYFSEAEVRLLVEQLKAKAAEGDTKTMIFLSEQIFGKAPQTMDVTSGNKPIPMIDITSLNKENGEVQP